jgi:hypothetical protein|nr:MAG TPA: hypothetical protein [Caudoviricetes sp.]
MKEFNLDAALNGEPVNANGQKCYVVREVTELLDDQSLRRFVVIFHESFTDAEVWDEYDFNDIRMWEEPKISIEDLPKPFKPQETESYYYINGGCIGYRNEYRYSNLFDRYAAENGNCFSTRECAEMWLKLMKGMLE